MSGHAARAAWPAACLGATVTVAANLLLGWMTLLPAAFVVLAASANVFGEISTDYNRDPGFYQDAGIVCALLIGLLFLGLNATLQYILPRRQRWLWLVAGAAYPVPYLVDLWSSR